MTMPGSVGYTVTAVTPDVQFGPTGQQIPGKALTIETTTGYTGTVFVPAAVLGDLDAVRQIIEQEVALVAAAKGLTGTVGGP